MGKSIDPLLHKISLNGVELAYFERGHPTEGKPTLLFVHATGFHGRIWDCIAESFPEVHILSFEQRGHGRSQNVLIDDWSVLGDDLGAFLSSLSLSNVIGIGHSMGAHSLVDAAAKYGCLSRLVLLDPVIVSPEAYSSLGVDSTGDGHPTARRKRHFDSVEEMIERLLPKSSFSLFEPRILADYCRYGLLPSINGGYELACPPEIEASVYMAGRTNAAIYESVRSLEIPVMVVRAKYGSADRVPGDFSTSPTWPDLASQFKLGKDVYLEDCSHFIPMQKPGLVVDLINEELVAWGESK